MKQKFVFCLLININGTRRDLTNVYVHNTTSRTEWCMSRHQSLLHSHWFDLTRCPLIVCPVGHINSSILEWHLFFTNWTILSSHLFLPLFPIFSHTFVISKIRSPDAFIPDRWLDSDVDAETLKEFFFPFSSGKRSCVGQNLAQLELMLFLASFFHFYDFELVSEITELLHLTLKPQNAHFKVTNRKL